MKHFGADFMTKLKTNLPKALAGGIVGAGIGALNMGSTGALGALLGPAGPIAGAIVGSGLSILSKTEAFQSIMFGKLNEETGEREGGLISQKMRERFKSMLPSAVGGAAVGALHGAIKGALGFNKGAGVLGMQLLPGGVLGGAVIGAGIGLLKNSESFNNFLFGPKDADGKRSGTFLSNTYNKVRGMFTGGLKDTLFKGLAGAGVGALTGTVLSNMGFLPSMLSLGGPIGMGIAGLGLGIASTSKRFNEYIFGTEYVGDDGKKHRREDGLLSKVRNLINVNLVEPIGNAFKEKLADTVDWIKDKIADPFRLAFGPLADSFKQIGDDIREFAKEKMESFGKTLYNATFGLLKNLFRPFTKLIGKIGQLGVSALAAGTKLALSPVSAVARGASLLFNKKRRTEEKTFRKSFREYLGSDEGQEALNEYYDIVEDGGKNKRNFIQRAMDRRDLRRARGEFADAFRSGYNAEMEEQGLNNLDWRSVIMEKRQRKTDRKARRADNKMWNGKIYKARQDIINKDLRGNSGVTLSDEAVATYRDRFAELGIDKDWMQTSDDIMQLLYRPDEFRARMNGVTSGKGGGDIDDVTKAVNEAETAQMLRDEKRDAFLNLIVAKMGGSEAAVKDAKARLDASIAAHAAHDRSNLQRRFAKAKLHGLDVNDPRFKAFNLDQFDDATLENFRASVQTGKGRFVKTNNDAFLKYLQDVHIDPIGGWTNLTGPVPEGLNDIPDANGSVAGAILNRLDTIAGNTEDQVQITAAANGIEPETVSGTKSPVRRWITRMFGNKRRSERANREAGESAGAASGRIAIPGARKSEAKTSIFSKIFSGIKFVGGKAGSFILNGLKTAGIIGLLGTVGFTIADLVHPGTIEKVNSKLEGALAYMKDKNGGVSGIVNSIGDSIKIKLSDFWNKKLKPIWDDGKGGGILPTLQNWKTKLVEWLPTAAHNIAGWLTDNIPLVTKTVGEVATEIAWPMAQIIWATVKGLATGIWDGIFKKGKNTEGISASDAAMLESHGIHVDQRLVATTSSEEAARAAAVDAGVPNAEVRLNEETGEYEVINNVRRGQRVATTADGRDTRVMNSQIGEAVTREGLKSLIFPAATKAGLKAGGKVVLKAGKIATGIVSKIPVVGVIGKLGKGALNLTEAAATKGSNFLGKTIGKITSKLGGKGAEQATKEAGKQLALTSLRSFADKITKIAESKLLVSSVDRLAAGGGASIASKAVEILSKLVGNAMKATGETLTKIAETVEKGLAKIAGNTALIVAAAATILIGGIFGAIDAPNLFGIDSSKVDGIMKTVSAIFGAFLNIPWIGTILDVAFTISVILGFNIKQDLAIAFYKVLVHNDEEKLKNLEIAQDQQEAERQIYNALNNTNLDKDAYNDVDNRTVFGSMWNGIKSIFGKGEVSTKKTSGRAYEILSASGMSDSEIIELTKDQDKLNSALARLGYGSGAKVSALGYGPGPTHARQDASAYANKPIGRFANGQVATMKTAGCGPTALANVMNQLALGYGPVSPAAVADYANAIGGLTNGGANERLFDNPPGPFRSTRIPPSAIPYALASGRKVVAAGEGGSFGPKPHIVSMSGNKMTDPNGGVSTQSPRNVAAHTNRAWVVSLGNGPGEEEADGDALIGSLGNLAKGLSNVFSKITGFSSSLFGLDYNDDETPMSTSTAIDSNGEVSGGYRDRFLKIARDQLGYLEKASNANLNNFKANPGNRNYTLYGKEFGANGYAWCANFMSWAAKAAGIPESVIPRSGSCSTIMQIASKMKIFHYRGDYIPVPGDLILFNWNCGSNPRAVGTSCDHVGIVESVDSQYVHTIEGNTSDPSKTSGYEGVYRKTYKLNSNFIVGYLHPNWPASGDASVNPNSLLSSTSYSSGNQNGIIGSSTPASYRSSVTESTNGAELTGGTNAEKVWRYLRNTIGLNPIAASGVMGNWQAESSVNPKVFEAYWLKGFPGFDKMTTNAAINAFTEQVLFPQYERQGLSISKSGYKGTDGNYYPGMGLAQWTGPRAQKMFSYMKSNGLDLWALASQLQFFRDEANTSYKGMIDKLNAQTSPKAAAEKFLDIYEMYEGFAANHQTNFGIPRGKNAESFYNQFKSTSLGYGPGVATNGETSSVDAELLRSLGIRDGMNVSVDSSPLVSVLTKIADLLVGVKQNQETAASSSETNGKAAVYGPTNVTVNKNQVVNNINHQQSSHQNDTYRRTISNQHALLSYRQNVVRSDVG